MDHHPPSHHLLHNQLSQDPQFSPAIVVHVNLYELSVANLKSKLQRKASVIKLPLYWEGGKMSYELVGPGESDHRGLECECGKCHQASEQSEMFQNFQVRLPQLPQRSLLHLSERPRTDC